ncbi:DUF6417 family protein [Streptomyces sp. NPDC096934]|uniref:DUF6417 family protein n=1 Tax=Streptomyces sp. NPDC096934 TaxID=3155551 RepID=UPI00331FDDFB
MLEGLEERGQAVGHGWTLDTEFLLLHQQQAGALAGHGLVELAGQEERAELSVLEGRPVRWAARLTPHGHDALTYGRLRPRAEPAPSGSGGGRPVELIPSQMAALRVFTHFAGRLRIPPAPGLAEQVRTASCDHGVKRWRLYLTEEQIASVAYGFWLHRMTGSAAEANRFTREYGATYAPSAAGPNGLPTVAGTAVATPWPLASPCSGDVSGRD